MVWPMPNWLLLESDAVVEVRTTTSSGEAEPVLVRLPSGRLLATVGSDETDRELEKTSVPLSKLVCPKIIAAEAWPFEEVAERWDDLRLRAFVGEPETLYQDERLAAIRPPHELLERSYRLWDDESRPLVVFLGTVPFRTAGLRYDAAFVATLEDEATRRTLRCRYSVVPVAPTADA
jgi:hypothetical protein